MLTAAFVAVGCAGEAGRWRVSDLDDPAAVLAAVEAEWHAEIEHRGSIVHEHGRCYFQLDPAGSTDDEDILDPLIACGPVSHWKGTVGPTPTPTAHESRGGRHVPVFDPTSFRVPYAGSTKWDYYRFKSIHHLHDDRTKVTATGPMASSHGRRTPSRNVSDGYRLNYARGLRHRRPRQQQRNPRHHRRRRLHLRHRPRQRRPPRPGVRPARRRQNRHHGTRPTSVRYTATDHTAGLPGPDNLHPRAGVLNLPTERFTVQLVTDEHADAAAPK